jgi:hypothetical protein
MRKSAIKVIILILSAGLFSMAMQSDLDDPRMVKIRGQFNKFYSDCHQEKVYIQTDRLSYQAGENIWFKAYIFSGINNYPDTANKNLYVEIVTADNEVYLTRLLKIQKGISYGDFMIPDTFPQGVYYLRAYTNWMRNFDDAFLFTRKIHIENENQKKWLTYHKLTDIKRFNRKFKRQLKNVDLVFLPEGGNLVTGLESRLAFKAIDNWGKGIEVEGQIFDDKNQAVAQFKSAHLGIGAINFKPEKGKSYHARLSKPEGISQKYKLSPALSEGVVLSIDQDRQNLNINIQSNRPPSNDEYANDIILLAQSNGKICELKKVDLRENRLKTYIPVLSFPDGIAHITLFDGRGDPICERLVFINNHKQLVVEVNSDKQNYRPREKVTMHVHVANGFGKPIVGNLSLAVTDAAKNGDTTANTENILS